MGKRQEKMKAIIFIGLLAMVLVCGCTTPSIYVSSNFITNASHGMVVNMTTGDVVLVGRAGYYGVAPDGDKYSVVMCEECGIDNDCLGNNLARIRAYNLTTSINEAQNEMDKEFVRNLTAKNLVFFYTYPITYEEVKAIQLPNETFQDAYQRLFYQKCDNPYYSNLIGEMVK
jgi:hypothetical protein